MASFRHPASMQILSKSCEETWGHAATARSSSLVLFPAGLTNVHGNSDTKMHQTATGTKAGF